jgi:hypothetical protein
MEVPEADNPAVAWLQGFLHAFAWFNHKTNYGYTFTLDVVPKPGSVREAIEGHFRGTLEELTLAPVEDWPGFVRGLLGRWLFQFDDRTRDHLKDPRKSFSLFNNHCRGMLLDEAMGRLSRVVSPQAVWKVEVGTRGWYECCYEDLAFEEAGRVVYLHAGFSD